MTIETIQNRIAGKEKAIAQLTKKLDRILKAKESNWEKNPYWYTERDLTMTQREIDSETAALENYKEMLKTEEEKANSRNVTALVEFLEQWKERSIEFFLDARERYLAAYGEYRAECKVRNDYKYSSDWYALTKEEKLEWEKKDRAFRKAFQEEWSYITQFDSSSRSWEDNMKRSIEIEKNRKYDDIIERTNQIVGQITDASGLYIGNKQDLNGYILGTRGRAEVRTIGAGGHSIQRFHFRTLVLPA